jgi:hypothetical protein
VNEAHIRSDLQRVNNEAGREKTKAGCYLYLLTPPYGDSTGYTTTQTLIGNNFWTPILGSIDQGPRYNSFGFDVGIDSSSPVTIELFTDVGTYTYAGLTVANTTLGHLQFEGYTASPGEYFTGFEIIADNGAGNLVGMTDVTLGNAASSVPDGGSAFALLGLGFTSLLAIRRRIAIA